MENLTVSPLPLFDAEDAEQIEHMKQFMVELCREKGYTETLEALSFAEKCHEGQFRKSRSILPYISHPLRIAVHAAALGLDDMNMLSACLLHDTIEDCGVLKEELPVSDRARDLVDLLSMVRKEEETREELKARYFRRLITDSEASMIKLIDRCNNISYMSDAFSKEKLQRYIEETERYIYPMAAHIREVRPEWGAVVFTLKYHIYSVISSIKNILERDLSK